MMLQNNIGTKTDKLQENFISNSNTSNLRRMLENLKTLMYTCLSESSIHGFYLIVKKESHFIERLFWLFCIVFCLWFTTDICCGQYSRYINNPTVLSIQTNHRYWKFPMVGVTICSNFTDRTMARKIVKRIWNITRNDSRFHYYEKFVLIIATAKYYNLQDFKEFANDESLNDIDFLNIAFEVIAFTRQLCKCSEYEMRQQLHDPPSPEYSNIITEMGICHSTSELAYIQKPYRKNNINSSDSNPSTPDKLLYSSVDIMRLTIIPHVLDSGNVTIYIHNNQDVISGADNIHNSLIESYDVILNVIQLYEIRSSRALRQALSYQRRKCLYYDEAILKPFPIYTTNLCRIQCRIQAAIDNCGCIPFFYNFDIPEPTCNSTGLYCLARTNWYDRKCNCYPLCDWRMYFQTSAEKVFYTSYSRFMEVTVKFPKSRIKRRIVFSVYELIVSFGGGAAFFLGCSFLSSVEIGFLLYEWLCCVKQKRTQIQSKNG